MATVSNQRRRSRRRWLPIVALLALALPACHDEKVAGPPAADGGADARVNGEAGAATDGATDVPAAQTETIDCFMGTPRTNEEFLNSCWPDDVASFAKKPNLPGGYQIGMPLPPPPP